MKQKQLICIAAGDGDEEAAAAARLGYDDLPPVSLSSSLILTRISFVRVSCPSDLDLVVCAAAAAASTASRDSLATSD
jgi:hypothetical protein